jgi:glycine hydroxymethyltransferase
MSSVLQSYLKSTPVEKINPSVVAYLANLTKTAEVSPQIAKSIVKELADQRSHLKLIASENYSSLSTQLTMGNLLTDKYAEGFPNHRYYAGCENIDDIEALACSEACKLFGAEHAYVQPHSGADANLVAYLAIIQARVGTPLLDKFEGKKITDLEAKDFYEMRQVLGNQKMLGLDYYSGGHLTHGYRMNVSAQLFDVHSYTVDRETNLLDYDALEAQAVKVKPLILLAGYSAYPRKINFRRFREIADKVGAVFMVDMAHFAGLVAGKVFEGDYDPVAFADVVTTTTHKTLRGPRGGMVLCKKEFAEYMDKGCPTVLGGPLGHVMAAKAVSFIEANRPEFKQYAKKIVENSQTLAQAFVEQGIKILTGGTENHLMLLDVRESFGLTGRQAEGAVRECGITLNRNSLPFDKFGAWFTSGLRVGTPAITTLGMGAAEMQEIAEIFKVILSATKPIMTKDGEVSKSKYEIVAEAKEEATKRTAALLAKYPVYPELDLELLRQI